MSTSFLLSAELAAYCQASSTPLDDIQHELIAVTADEVGDFAMMQAAPDVGSALSTIVRMVAPRFAVEVGTFTGYSALCIAAALPADGRLLCCDISDEWTRIGRPYWERAGVADRIELVLGPATETLDGLAHDQAIDFAFIDADKPNYTDYYEAIVERLRPGGVIAVDNVLWSGAVVDPAATDDNTRAIRAFNEHAAADDRTESALLSVGDGLSLHVRR
ncbi:MAG: class I SAM-dependent methyltransferase [Acidimicrobiia bacterium]|nr:class I SAM-dependent methyltransferase [Acidimicrobiia bacterium]